MNNLLNIAIGSVTIGGIIIFLGKQLINKGFDAALKTFENRLELLKIEHQIKYSKLHEERAIVLKDLYKHLYKLEESLVNMTTSYQDAKWTKDDERRDKASEQLLICQDMIEENRIYFTSNFCDLLIKNLNDCLTVIHDMEKAKSLGRVEEHDIKLEKPYRFKEGETPLDLWLEQERKVKIEIRNNRIQLAANFRELIGVEKGKN